MGKVNDISGKIFGRWKVLGMHPERNSGRNVQWYCVCSCGTNRVLSGNVLINGKSSSCGCYRDEVRHLAHNIHGGTGSKIYSVFQGMKNRCYNDKSEHFHSYGGRGICVSDCWLDNFSAFRAWAKNNGYVEGLQIDRRNVNGNYEPNNCRFVTSKVNINNKRAKSICGKSGVVGAYEIRPGFFSSVCSGVRLGTYKGKTLAGIIRDIYAQNTGRNTVLNFPELQFNCPI